MSAAVRSLESTIISVPCSYTTCLFPCRWASDPPLLPAPGPASFLIPRGLEFLSPTSLLDTALATPLALAPPPPSHSPAFRWPKAGGPGAPGLADRRSRRHRLSPAPESQASSWIHVGRPGLVLRFSALRGVKRCSRSPVGPGNPCRVPRRVRARTQMSVSSWLLLDSPCDPGQLFLPPISLQPPFPTPSSGSDRWGASR